MPFRCRVAGPVMPGRYETQGAVLIDTPFSTEQIDVVEAAWDQCIGQGKAAYDAPAILEAIQHPFWEELTKQFLRADEVVYWWTVGPHNRPPAKRPEDGGAWPHWQKPRPFQHRRIAYTLHAGTLTQPKPSKEAAVG